MSIIKRHMYTLKKFLPVLIQVFPKAGSHFFSKKFTLFVKNAVFYFAASLPLFFTESVL